MIKFCNNEEGQQVQISLSAYFDDQFDDLEPVNVEVEDQTTKESSTEIVKIEKVQKA